jgi:hypothetical protein
LSTAKGEGVRPPRTVLATLTAALALFAGAGAAWASSLTLSTYSSDATPASQLDATVAFDVGDFDLGNAGDELKITLTNPSAGEGGDALFNLNELYWNAASNVSGLSLLSATHSVNGDVTGLWTPVEPDLSADGFGTFDFALTDGVGMPSPGIIMPGQSVVFILDITGTGPFDMSDFVEPNSMGYLAAVKFVNGPDDPEAPGMEDSAYGAVVPEPATAGMLVLGLLGLAAAGRRRA